MILVRVRYGGKYNSAINAKDIRKYYATNNCFPSNDQSA